MKKILLVAALLLVASPVFAEQGDITVGTAEASASLDTNFANAQANFTELYGWVDQGVKSTNSPVFAGVNLGVASTTTGLLNFYGNTKAFPFGLFSQGADSPGIGLRLPSTMPTVTSIFIADTNGYMDYLDPAGFAAALTSDQNYVSDAQITLLENTSGSNTGDQSGATVAFADTDNLFTATMIGPAIEEFNDSINSGVPNSTGAKVHWSQIAGMPAVFADGTDDGAAGEGISHATSDGAYYASKDGAWASLTGLYLAAGGTAANSALLENHAASYFQTALTDPLVRADIDDIPVNSEITGPVSSNWAYDHGAAADPHIGYALESALGTASSRNAEDTLTDGSNLPDGAAIKAYGDANWGGGSLPDGTATNQLLQWSGTAWAPVSTIAGIGNISGAGSYNKVTVTEPATGATLTLADGSTLATSGAYSLTLTQTGNSNVTLPTAGTLATLSDIPAGSLPTCSVDTQTVEWDTTTSDWICVDTVSITAGTGITISSGAISVTANTYQPLDSDLTSIAALTTNAVGLSLLDDTSTSALRTSIGMTANGSSLVVAADYAAMRTLLDLEAGTDFNSYDEDLTDLADGSLSGSKVGTGINGDNVTSGTIADARIASTITRTVASGTSALGTTEIASGACASAVTTSATGTATTDVINWGFNGDPTGVTGYAPTANGMLTIIAYPSADNVNYRVCNLTAAAITPGAITLNWRIQR